MNKEMLSIANKYKDIVSEKVGFKNVEFRRGKIQNLKLDLKKLKNFLNEHSIKNIDSYPDLEFTIKELEKNIH